MGAKTFGKKNSQKEQKPRKTPSLRRQEQKKNLQNQKKPWSDTKVLREEKLEREKSIVGRPTPGQHKKGLADRRRIDGLFSSFLIYEWRMEALLCSALSFLFFFLLCSARGVRGKEKKAEKKSLSLDLSSLYLGQWDIPISLSLFLSPLSQKFF